MMKAELPTPRTQESRIYGHLSNVMPPDDVVQAARKVRAWADSMGFRSWQIAGCYSAPSTHRPSALVQDFELADLHGGSAS